MKKLLVALFLLLSPVVHAQAIPEADIKQLAHDLAQIQAELSGPQALSETQAAMIYAMAHSVSGYPLPEKAPAIHIISQVELSKLAGCEGVCNIMGMVDNEGVVYVVKELDFSNPLHASVLFHELVHYLQWVNKGPLDGTCEVWMEREMEAFKLQWLVLMKAGLPEMAEHVRQDAIGYGKCSD
jgi:hypothetical protein